MANKYILIDGKLIFGNVGYHSELVPKGAVNTKPEGGGWFKWQDATKYLYLYGASSDYGWLSIGRISDGWKRTDLPENFIQPGVRVFHSHSVQLSDDIIWKEITDQLK